MIIDSELKEPVTKLRDNIENYLLQLSKLLQSENAVNILDEKNEELMELSSLTKTLFNIGNMTERKNVEDKLKNINKVNQIIDNSSWDI